MLKTLLAISTILIIGSSSAASPSCREIFLNRHDAGLTAIAQVISNGTSQLPKIENGIFARILRGKKDSDFDVLSADRGRAIVMLMDSGGIEATFSNRGQPMSPLERIGYTRQYINELHSRGIKFRVVLFKQNNQILPATWSNLGVYLNGVYGKHKVVLDLFKRYLPELKRFSFEELAAMSGHSGVIENASLKTLTPESSLWEFRSFLYNELRLTELYSGDGYTRTPDGQVGLREYFYFNKKLEELDSYEVAEIPN